MAQSQVEEADAHRYSASVASYVHRKMTSNDSRHVIIEAIVQEINIVDETASIPSARGDPGGPEEKVLFFLVSVRGRKPVLGCAELWTRTSVYLKKLDSYR